MNESEGLIHLAHHVETSIGTDVIRYTDSVVGLSHCITTAELASGIREIARGGENAVTNRLYDLLIARSDGDVVVPSEIGEILDAISLYLAMSGSDTSKGLLRFEMAVLRICGNSGGLS